MTAHSDVLRAEIAEQGLEDVLDDPAASVVDDHQNGQGELELGAERHKTQLLVQFRDEFGGTGEGNARSGDQAPVHSLVLADRLSEGTPLVVDGKGRDLLNKLEKVDSAVQQRRLEFALQVNVRLSPMILSATFG